MYRLTAVDTDSIKFCREDGKPMSQEEMNNIIKKLNDETPEKILLEEDGYYDNFLVIKSKNYVTYKAKKNKITHHGSSVTDQKKEPALKEFIFAAIDNIMFQGSKNLQDIYHKYVIEAMNIKDISRWVVKKTVTEKLYDSDRANETKVIDAINDANIDVNMGDKVWVYSAIEGEKQAIVKGEPFFYKKTGLPKMIPNKILKIQEQWTQDEDKLHYVSRVYKTLMILENLLDKEQFIDYSNKSNKKLLEKLCQKVK